jgi:hypothetical protein
MQTMVAATAAMMSPPRMGLWSGTGCTPTAGLVVPPAASEDERMSAIEVMFTIRTPRHKRPH